MSARKLDTTEVNEIRQLVDEGWTNVLHGARSIALAYGISLTYMYDIGDRSVRGNVRERDGTRARQYEPRLGVLADEVRT